MHWRSDIVAMLRARWWLLGGWIVLVLGIVVALGASDWWQPRHPGVVAVRSRAAAKEHLLKELVRFDEKYAFALGYDGDTSVPGDVDDTDADADLDSMPIFDDAAGELDAQLKRAATSCAKQLPFSAHVVRGGTFPVDLDLTMLESSTSETIDSGYTWDDPKVAPKRTTYVQVVATATNHGDKEAYPSASFGIVTSQGKLYAQVYESVADGLSGAQPDEEIAGVVLFRLPKAAVEQAQLYGFVAENVFVTSAAAGALRDGDCARLEPTPAEAVGTSDRVDNARLVE